MKKTTVSKVSDVEKLLRGIGKRIFVKYYDCFATEDRDACRKALSAEGFTDKAVNSRTSKGIRIFREHKEAEALENIKSSNRLDDSIRDEADRILKTIAL